MKLILLFTFLPLLTFANDCDLKDMSDLMPFQTCLESIQKSSKGPSWSECKIKTSWDKKCDDRYKRLLNDGTINITMAGGYGDYFGAQGGTTWDKEEAHTIVSMLTSSCPLKYDQLFSSETMPDGKVCGAGGSFSKPCGFKRTDDPEIFIKEMVVRGKKVNVRVQVLSASMSDNDKLNRKSTIKFLEEKVCHNVTNKKACLEKNSPTKIPTIKLAKNCKPEDRFKYQVCQSDYVRRTWAKSIMQGDEIVMFSGHARDGGGPSFDPPRVMKDGHVDYNWYRKNREGHKQETQALEIADKNGKAPVIYASHACNSKKHFLLNGNLGTASPQTAYVLSNRTSYESEALTSNLAILNGVFSGKCQKDFDKDIQGASCAFNLHNF